jgi:hypothetical protein
MPLLQVRCQQLPFYFWWLGISTSFLGSLAATGSTDLCHTVGYSIVLEDCIGRVTHNFDLCEFRLPVGPNYLAVSCGSVLIVTGGLDDAPTLVTKNVFAISIPLLLLSLLLGLSAIPLVSKVLVRAFLLLGLPSPFLAILPFH